MNAVGRPPRARPLSWAVALLAAVLLTGCSPGSGGESASAGAASPGAETGSASSPAAGTSAPSSAPSSATSPNPSPPAPPRQACYRLGYEEAIAATNEAVPVDCGSRHTARTFHVGRFDAVMAGHLLAVDSREVQQQIAEGCQSRIAGFLGTSTEQLRLSMFRAVWFSPTVAESDAGARWFRCDAVVVAGSGTLLPLPGRIKGALDGERGRSRFGMCGTAEPGTESFERVVCSRPHRWRAIDTVGFEQRRYPGTARVREAGDQACQGAAREAAEDPLDFTWSYEWPTRDRWEAGVHHGICWLQTG